MFICASLTGTQKHQVLRPKTVLSLQLVAAVCSCCLLQLQLWQGQWERGRGGSRAGTVGRCTVVVAVAVAHEYAQLK